MRRFPIFLFLICLGGVFVPGFAQDTSLYLPKSSNQLWLNSLKDADITAQWNMIKTRMLLYDEMNTGDVDAGEKPNLLIDGVLIQVSPNTDISTRNRILALVSMNDIIEIDVHNKAPKDANPNRKFTGNILVETGQGPIYRKLKRIRY